MATIDIFNDNAFSMVSLTQAINKVDYQPNLLGRLNIFEEEPVRTTSIAIEKRESVLSLVPTSARGAPLEQRATEKRDIRDFRLTRIAKADRLQMDEIQNIRAFGSETEMMAIQDEVMRRYAGPAGIIRDLEVTMEHMRLGAVQGIVYDADGVSVIKNWFAEWGIAQPAEIDFALGTAATDVRGKCATVVRNMAKASKGAWIEGITEVHALCGDTFYDSLIDHPKVRDTYLNWTAAADLRQGMAYGAFRFGGIVFHNYRGTDDGSKIAIDTNKAKFFPVNAPGVFKAAFGPAEWAPNTPGQPMYGMIVPDRDRGMWVDIEAYSYPLFVCTRPDMLQRAKRA